MTKEEKLEMNKEKLKALQLTMDKIEKSYGKGSIMRLGDRAVDDVAAISSGSIGLDYALGVGGFPKGRVIEIYALNHQEKQPWQFMPLLKHKKWGGLLPLLMLNMHSILITQKVWV